VLTPLYRTEWANQGGFSGRPAHASGDD